MSELASSFKFANLLLVAEQLLGKKLSSLLLNYSVQRVRNRLLKKLNQQKVPEAQAIPRTEGLSPKEFLENYFNLSKPVVFSQVARDWPACRTWTLDFLAEYCKDSELLLVDTPGLTTRSMNTNFELLDPKELVKNIRSGGDSYLRFSPLIHEHPELADDLDMNWLESMRGPGTFGNTYYMFVGGKGKKTYLHADQPCNLYVQIYGEKKWTLYLPEQSACLYPEVTNTAFVKSPVDIDKPDLEKHPLFPHAQAYEVHVKAGDVLYVPPHVWHQVENLSDTIAVGYRYSSMKAALKSSVAFSLIRLLSTNPPLWKTREYGQKDTNLIWAHSSGIIKDVLKAKKARAPIE